MPRPLLDASRREVVVLLVLTGMLILFKMAKPAVTNHIYPDFFSLYGYELCCYKNSAFFQFVSSCT